MNLRIANQTRDAVTRRPAIYFIKDDRPEHGAKDDTPTVGFGTAIDPWGKQGPFQHKPIVSRASSASTTPAPVAAAISDMQPWNHSIQARSSYYSVGYGETDDMLNKVYAECWFEIYTGTRRFVPSR